ncbi:MAG TPA: FAD-binding oxidoreductase [Vicinamibacteria bacterium]|nr:FAD-binding oxidoreductase [Vicinamibacteria bacterium]
MQDAARTPGGHTPVVALPRDEAEVAAVLREAPAVVPVGAQSSLTGGATPFGEWVLSLARMDRIEAAGPDRVHTQAGVALSTLEDHLRLQHLFYPPVPTFRGAFVGGVLATNAAGAATFKYGSTRRWVKGLTVVLASGDILDLARGACVADGDGFFEIEGADGRVFRVPIPTYRMPEVAKRSAGYHAAPGMDLVDLFVGSEGTLGVITEATLGLLPEPGRFLAWVSFAEEARALAAVARLREVSGAGRGLEVAAIESLDRRCLELLREDGADREHGVRLPDNAASTLLIEIEFPAAAGPSAALEELSRLLEAEAALDPIEIALPEERTRAEHLLALREAVPLAVNHRIAALQQAGEPEVHKTAADMIVPFEHLPAMIARYREGFSRRGLDHALWGHVSDGNLHANAIPRSRRDVELGEEAILEFGREVIRLGGCPLSEHGVGRSPVKQALLRELYGERGIAEMRQVKAALDPKGKLSPGVLFPR